MRKRKSRLFGKNGKAATCAAICHTITTVMTQAGVNFKLAKCTKRFYVLDEETGILEKNVHVDETADKGLKFY